MILTTVYDNAENTITWKLGTEAFFLDVQDRSRTDIQYLMYFAEGWWAAVESLTDDCEEQFSTFARHLKHMKGGM